MNFLRKKDDKKEEEIQFDLGLDEPYLNRFFALKQRLGLKLKQFETKTFVRSFSNWFYIIVSLSLILLQFKYLEDTYNKLPTQIPLYRYMIDLQSRLEIQEGVYLMPLLSIAIFTVSIAVGYKWYNKKKHLALFTLFFMFLSISTITISLAKLLSQFYG